MVTPTNPGGELDLNDLEMEGKLLAWLVLEGLTGTENTSYKYVGLFGNNMVVMLWTQRGAAKNPTEAGCLLRVLDLRKQVA